MSQRPPELRGRHGLFRERFLHEQFGLVERRDRGFRKRVEERGKNGGVHLLLLLRRKVVVPAVDLLVKACSLPNPKGTENRIDIN